MIELFQKLFVRNERVSAISIGALMLISVVVMGIISLTALNDKLTKGYLLNRLEEQRQELVTDGEVTDMMTLYARSMTSIEDNVRGMSKPEAGDIVYVMPITAMAQR